MLPNEPSEILTPIPCSVIEQWILAPKTFRREAGAGAASSGGCLSIPINLFGFAICRACRRGHRIASRRNIPLIAREPVIFQGLFEGLFEAPAVTKKYAAPHELPIADYIKNYPRSILQPPGVSSQHSRRIIPPWRF